MSRGGGPGRGTSEVMKTMFRLASAVIRTQISVRRRCLGLLRLLGSNHARDLQTGASRAALRSRVANRPGDGAVMGPRLADRAVAMLRRWLHCT